MQQKYSPNMCAVSNICFQIVHKKKLVQLPSKEKNKCQSSSRLKESKNCTDRFIPTSFNIYRKQLASSLKILRRDARPLIGQDLQQRGFPARKVRTSHSQRSLMGKKEKNFLLGQYDPPVFSNPKLSELINSEIKQRQCCMCQYMSKSALENYNSQRSNCSAKMRRSIF